MKKILVSFFSIIVFLSIFTSDIFWHSINITPNQIYDITSIKNYNSSFMDVSALNKIIIINYERSYISGMGIIQGEYGRIGITIDAEEDSVLSDYISQFFNRTINPVKMGMMLAKKIDYLNFGFAFQTFLLNDYYYAETIYDNINSHFNYFNIAPSLSLDLPGDIIIEFSPQFIIKNAYYEDYVTTITSTASMDYSINGRIIQNNNDNYYLIYIHYNSSPFNYAINSNDITDNYIKVNDSLNIGLIIAIKSFDYINSYFSFAYLNVSNYSSTNFSGGSQIRNKITNTVLPAMSMGFDIYINRHISFLLGLQALWTNTLYEDAPNLEPDNMISNFDYNYSLGLTFSYNNLNIDIGFNNSLISLPFFISGNALNNSELSLGITFFGFEY